MTTIGRNKIIEIGKTIIPYFELKGDDIENYQLLFYYFTKNEEKCNDFKIDINKGLWVFGEIGSGKSIAMKVFQEFCAYTPHIGNRRYSIYRFKKIEDEYEKYKSDIFDYYGIGALRDLCYDEFLKSSGLVNNFGIKKNLPELLLDDRYEVLMNTKFKTHVTTNVPPLYLAQNQILDERTLDRANAMFNMFEWKGGTKRK